MPKTTRIKIKINASSKLFSSFKAIEYNDDDYISSGLVQIERRKKLLC